MRNNINIAKKMMKLFPQKPSIEEVDYWSGKGEKSIRSLEAYEHESLVGLERYFKIPIGEYIYGKEVLDFGCGHAGRTVRWLEKFQFKRVVGIDHSEVHLKWANTFIKKKNFSNIHLIHSAGENLQFESDTFECVLSFEVFDHVNDPQKCLEECHRVLKKNGIVVIVFTPFYSPKGAHLHFTRMPWMNVFFKEDTLIQAHNEIARELGAEYEKTYKFNSIQKEVGCPKRFGSVNGLTVKGFDEIIEMQGWEVLDKWNVPIFHHGKLIHARKELKLLSFPASMLTKVPYFDEMFTHYVSRVLQKV